MDHSSTWSKSNRFLNLLIDGVTCITLFEHRLIANKFQKGKEPPKKHKTEDGDPKRTKQKINNIQLIVIKIHKWYKIEKPTNKQKPKAQCKIAFWISQFSLPHFYVALSEITGVCQLSNNVRRIRILFHK